MSKSTSQRGWLNGILAALVAGLMLVACAPPPPDTASAPAATGAAQPVGDLTGEVRIDGSSTVGPLSAAVAEEFRGAQPGINVSVGISGTGGGMKKFVAGEIDIVDASRPIKDSEIALAKEHGIEFIELPVAFDGLAIVVSTQNTWVDQLSIAELKRIWEPNSQVKNWSDVRPGFPNEPLKLYGPGTDSGTFEYFTEQVCGEAGASRVDYTPSEDDNALVKGVEGDKGALAYFGHAYYEENADKLKLVPVVGDSGEPVLPTKETIADGSYKPLSRPLFIYVATPALDRPEVVEFVNYYVHQVGGVAAHAGYVALPETAQALVVARWDARTHGSAFSGVHDQTVEAVLGGSPIDAAPAEAAPAADGSAE